MRWLARTVLSCLVLSALGFLYTVTLFAIGKFGGVEATVEQPYVWDSGSGLVMVLETDAPRGSGCTVVPRTGLERDLVPDTSPEVVRRGAFDLPAFTFQPWFTGPADVTCTDARLFGQRFASLLERPDVGVIPGGFFAGLAVILLVASRVRQPKAQSEPELQSESAVPAQASGTQASGTQAPVPPVG